MQTQLGWVHARSEYRMPISLYTHHCRLAVLEGPHARLDIAAITGHQTTTRQHQHSDRSRTQNSTNKTETHPFTPNTSLTLCTIIAVGGITVPFALPAVGGYNQGTFCTASTPYISSISDCEKPPPMKMALGTRGCGLLTLEPRPDDGIVISPFTSGGSSDFPTGALLITWTTVERQLGLMGGVWCEGG